MKIESKDGPNISPLPTGQPSARERAIAKLMEGAPTSPAVNQRQQEAVANPTQVSPEELSVVKSSSQSEASLTQTDSVDSPSKEAEVKTATKEDPLSTQYALLARKEKALRAKVQAQEVALRAKEEAFAAREAAIKAKEAEYASEYIPKSRFKADPLTILAEQGVSYDEITKAILNPQAPQDPRVLVEIEKLKEELKATKESQNKAKEEYVAQQKRAYDQAVNQIRNEAKQLINTDPMYETIKETNSLNDVVELIEKTYNEDGVLLTVEEAAKEVEEYLVEEAIKLAKINKIKSRLQESQKPVQQPQSQPAQKQPQQMKTLTNSVNASKPMSSRERAIAAFKGELK